MHYSTIELHKYRIENLKFLLTLLHTSKSHYYRYVENIYNTLQYNTIKYMLCYGIILYIMPDSNI